MAGTPINSATQLSQALAEGWHHHIPIFTDIFRANGHPQDLANAFAIARDIVQQYTTSDEGQEYFITRDIGMKWANVGDVDPFRYMSIWGVHAQKVLLFDIWRDIIWLKEIAYNSAEERLANEANSDST